MPATVKRFGVKNVFDVEQNVDAGARYLRWLLDRFEGRVELALAGYNAGEGAVDRHRGIPPYAETEWYVLKVLDRAGRTGQSATP
jgi:soluble lytic murein transglycosylase-like protein